MKIMELLMCTFQLSAEPSFFLSNKSLQQIFHICSMSNHLSVFCEHKFKKDEPRNKISHLKLYRF